MDLREDCEVGNLETPRVAYKRRSSFFNLPSKESEAVTPKKEKYIEKLISEEKDWADLLGTAHKRVKTLANAEKIVYDSSILSQERKDYMAQAIDVSEFLKGHEELKLKALFYMKKKEWTRMRVQFFQEQLGDKLAREAIKGLSLSNISKESKN